MTTAGTQISYDYANGDPVNGNDLSGNMPNYSYAYIQVTAGSPYAEFNTQFGSFAVQVNFNGPMSLQWGFQRDA